MFDYTMNPYAPPATSEEVPVRSQHRATDDRPRKGSRIVGTVVFAGAFLILGDVVLQPFFDAIVPIRLATGLGMGVGLVFGVSIGLKVCRCLDAPVA